MSHSPGDTFPTHTTIVPDDTRRHPVARLGNASWRVLRGNVLDLYKVSPFSVRPSPWA